MFVDQLVLPSHRHALSTPLPFLFVIPHVNTYHVHSVIVTYTQKIHTISFTITFYFPNIFLQWYTFVSKLTTTCFTENKIVFPIGCTLKLY